MSEKLTEWFSGEVNPTIPGVYQRRWNSGEPFMFPYYKWDGRIWRGSGHSTASEAEQSIHRASFQQNAQWRGLAENPEK